MYLVDSNTRNLYQRITNLIKKRKSITKENLNYILNCKHLKMAVYKKVLDSDRNPIIDFVTLK